MNLLRKRRAATWLVAFIALGAAGGQLGLGQAAPAVKQAEAAYNAGSLALNESNLSGALADFQKVIRLLPSSAQGHSAVGLVLLRMGRAQESVPEFERSLALKPGDTGTEANLALAYENLGQTTKELTLLTRLDAASRAQQRPLPANVSTMYVRALVAHHDLPGAISRMKQAVAAAPNDAGLHDNLGSLYAMEKDWPHAADEFHAALSADPNLASAHLHLGLALQAQQAAGATDELEAAYKLSPENAVVNLEYGRALATAGDDARALPRLEHAHELSPESPDVDYQFALALQRANRTPEALPLFEKAAVALPADSDLLTNYGMALCQQQHAKEAVPLLQKAVELAPKNPTARQNLAAAYIQLSQFDDAVTQLRAAIRLAPESPQLHYNLGLALKMQDNLGAAIPELETAEKLNPAAPEPPNVLGLLHMQGGRYADAARELNLSLKLQPDNGEGWATLGSVDNHLDQLPEAMAALNEAIRQMPQQPDPHLTLAAVLAKQGKPSEATAERRLAAELMRTNMNQKRAEVATNAGTSLLKNGKVTEAIVEFQNAIGFDPKFADGHLGLADAFDRQGRNADAAAERQKAASLQPK